MTDNKYVSPQQEMEALATSLTQFFKIASVVPLDPASPGQKELLATKKEQAERLQTLIKQNGFGNQGIH